MTSAISTLRALFAPRRGAGRDTEAGFTLVELLISMTMLTAILAGSMTLLIGMMQKQPGLSDRSDQVAEARLALERMVREIRPGYAVDSAAGTSNTVSFRTYMRRTCAGGVTSTVTLCRVTYTCSTSTTQCTRSTANPDGSSPTTPRVLIKGVTNNNVFSVQSTYIRIRLVMPADDGGSEITVLDGSTLRNATLGF